MPGQDARKAYSAHRYRQGDGQGRDSLRLDPIPDPQIHRHQRQSLPSHRHAASLTEAFQAQSDVARLNRTIGSLGIGSYVSSLQPAGNSPPPPPPPAEAGASTSSSTTAQQPSPTDPFHPLATATLDTTVFDVVHMFSDRGISAVPIIDEDGVVINMYESVDIVVRLSPFLCTHRT